MTFEDFLAEFRKAKRGSTAESYGFFMAPLKRWLTSNSRDAERFTATDIQDYFAARTDLTDRSKNTVLGMIKRFARWQRSRTSDINERMRLEQIAEIIPFKVERRAKRRALNMDELKLLVETAKDQDAALIYLLAYSGIRKSEIESLRNADFEQNRLVIYAKKTKAERILFFNSEFGRVLKTAIERGYLDVLPNTLNSRFRQYNHTLDGIKLSPHSLRRTFNVHMRRRISDALLRILMGHAEKSITDVYDEAMVGEIKTAMIEKHYLADFICPFRIKEIS